MPVALTSKAQALILGNVLKGHPAAQMLITAVQPTDWTIDEYKEIWGVIQQYWVQHKCFPKQVELLELCTPKTAASVYQLYETSGYETVPELIDLVMDYVKTKRLRLLLDQAASILQTDPQKAEQIVRSGIMSMPTATVTVTKVQDLLPEAIYHYEDSIFGFPTGISLLDQSLHGGVGLGEIFVVAAPAGTGKSSLLCSIANNVAKFTAVLYLSLELKAVRVAQLMAAATGQIRQSEADSRLDTQRFVKLHRTFDARFPILIDYRPSGTVTTNQVGNMIDYLRNVEGIYINAIFVDYADLLLPSKGSKYAAKWERIDEIYQELEDISRIFNIAVYTASHVDREGSKMEASALDRSSIAGSMGKVNKCDISIGWKPLSTEGGLTKGILSFMKVRNGATPEPHIAIFDYDRLKLNVIAPFKGQQDIAVLGGANPDLTKPKGGRRF